MATLFYRKLGDGAVVFDPESWLTHILTPSAAIIFEALAELAEAGPVTYSQALHLLQADLEVDTDTPKMQQVLRSLQEMGMLGE